MEQKVIELNLPAKIKYLEHMKVERRNKMRQWRKMDYLLFDSEASFKDWLDYTKWHKRPVETKKVQGYFHVKFLDYKPPKKLSVA